MLVHVRGGETSTGQRTRWVASACAALLVALSFLAFALQPRARDWQASDYDPADYRMIAEHFWGVRSVPETYGLASRGDWAEFLRTVPFRGVGPGTLYLASGVLRAGRAPADTRAIEASGRVLAAALKVSLAAALLALFVVVRRRWGMGTALVALAVTAFPPHYWRMTDDFLAEPIERVLFVLLIVAAVAIGWRRPSRVASFAMIGLLLVAAQTKSQWVIAAALLLPVLLAQVRASGGGIRRAAALAACAALVPLSLLAVNWIGWRTTSLSPGVGVHVHLKYGDEVLRGFCDAPHHSYGLPAFCDASLPRHRWWNLSFAGGASAGDYADFDRYARRYVLGHPVQTAGAVWDGLKLASTVPGIERLEGNSVRLRPLAAPWRTIVQALDVLVWLLLAIGLCLPETRVPAAAALALWIVPALGNAFSKYELRYHVPMAGLALLAAWLTARALVDRARRRRAQDAALWKKVILVPFGASLGILLASVGVAAWHLAAPSERPLGAADAPYLRRVLDANPRAIFMFDPDTLYRYKPSFQGVRSRPTHLKDRTNAEYAHVTNSLGLIGGDEVNLDPAVAKLLLLGDSVAYGVWVDPDDAFPARIQKMAGPGYQVLLGACEGWSTRQEAEFYDRYLARIGWRAVFLVFSLNDLVDFEWKYKSGEGVQLADEMARVGAGLGYTNQTAAGLKLAAMRVRFASHAATAPLAGQSNATLYAWDDGRWTSYLKDTLGPFVQRRSGRPVHVVVAPTLNQLQALARGASAETVLWPQARMRSFCADRALTCIDLAEAFVGKPDEELRGLFLDDLHFSEQGHALVANYLWPRMEAAAARARADGRRE